MSLSPAMRVQLGLDEADDLTNAPAPSGEFDQTPPASGQMPVRVFNPKLVLREGEKSSAPKIRQMVNELLAGNIENADWALKQLFAVNPKLGLELYIELAQFSLPKLKAVAVQVDDRSDNPRTLSIAQLTQALQGD